jgi:DNA-directed RNA polymerase subunit M/transcription elongation factor TFIIS
MDDKETFVVVCVDCGFRMKASKLDTDIWVCTECGSLFVERDDHWDIVEKASRSFCHSLGSGRSWTKEEVDALVKDDMGIDYPDEIAISDDIIVIGVKNEEGNKKLS